MDAVLARFVAQLAPEQAAGIAPRSAEAAALLRELCEQARAAHPEIALEDGELAAALAARLPADGDPIDGLRRVHVADLRLACACATGDPAALERFDTLLAREVDAAAASVRAPAGLADEVKQRLREQLLVGDGEKGPGIGEYAGRGGLRSFLRITSVRECLRVLKRQRREVGMDNDDLARMVPAMDPELERLKATYRGEFAACFAAALAALDARERTLLRLHALEHLSIDQIGAFYGVHRATAARWLERARLQVAEHTEQLLAERLTLSTAEVASVIRLVRSQLDVTLERLLADPPEGH